MQCAGKNSRSPLDQTIISITQQSREIMQKYIYPFLADATQRLLNIEADKLGLSEMDVDII